MLSCKPSAKAFGTLIAESASSKPLILARFWQGGLQVLGQLLWHTGCRGTIWRLTSGLGTVLVRTRPNASKYL